MSAYWIGRAQVLDVAAFQRYGKLVTEAATLYPYDALARAGRYKVLEGPDGFDRFVILRFSSMEAAGAYYNSPEYQAAAACRRAAAGRCEIVITEGIE
jgi:uncharacterized protein (DUF1330 family)